MNKFRNIKWLILLALASGFAFSQKLPPLGKRIYVVDKGGEADVQILDAQSKKSSGITLKDPTLQINKSNLEKDKHLDVIISKPKTKVAPKAIVKVSKPNPVKGASALRFKKSRITGNLREPRVKFVRNELAVGMRDEPIKRDFFLKVFEDLKDYEN